MKLHIFQSISLFIFRLIFLPKFRVFEKYPTRNSCAAPLVMIIPRLRRDVDSYNKLSALATDPIILITDLPPYGPYNKVSFPLRFITGDGLFSVLATHAQPVWRNGTA